MALSDDEQRRLDEMERGLALDDPRFAAGVSIDQLRRRRRVVGAVVFLVGIVVLLVGLVMTAVSPPVGVVTGVAGLLIMIAAVVAVFFRRRGLG